MNKKQKAIIICAILLLSTLTVYFVTSYDIVTFLSSNYNTNTDEYALSNLTNHKWSLDSRDMFWNRYKCPTFDVFDTYMYRLETSMIPLNYQNDNDEWNPIDVNITSKDLTVSGREYVFGTDTGVYKAYFREQSSDVKDRPMAILKDNCVLTFSPTDYIKFEPHLYGKKGRVASRQRSTAIVNESQITFPDQYRKIRIFDGFADLTYNYAPIAVKENLMISDIHYMRYRFKSQCKPEDYYIVNLTFENIVRAYYLDDVDDMTMGIVYGRNKTSFKDFGVDTDGKVTTDEEIYFIDANKNVVYYIPKIYAHDSHYDMVDDDVEEVFYENFSYILLNKTISMTSFGNLRVTVLTPWWWLDDVNRTYPVYIDPTTTVSVGQSSDDCYENSAATFYSDVATVMYAGNRLGTRYHTYYRFALPILSNSTIQDAYLRLHTKQCGGWPGTSDYKVKLNCVDEDNTSTFAVGDKPSARLQTTNTTYYNVSLVGLSISFNWRGFNGGYSFENSVQEVTDRIGWNGSNGSMIAVCFETQVGTDTNIRYNVHSFDFNGGSNPPKLVVTYLPPGNMPPDKPDNPSPANNTDPAPRYPTLQVDVEDPKGDVLTAYWYHNGTIRNTSIGLVPNANGTSTNIPTVVGASTHWQAVKSYDDDDSYVQTATEVWTNDTYNITNVTGKTIETINFVRLYAYVKDTLASAGASNIRFITLNNSIWNESAKQTIFMHGGYDYKYKTYITNPQTGLPWSWADIDNFEFGFGWNTSRAWFRCTYFKVIVNYTSLESEFFHFATNTSIPSGTRIQQVDWSMDTNYTRYWWYVNVTDGTLSNQSDIFNLKTGSWVINIILNPGQEDYNESTPVPLNVTFTTPSGLPADVYWYEYHTNSSSTTLLDLQTNLGNGTHTYNWYCGPGSKRWYVYVDCGNFTNTTDVHYFMSDKTWRDDFWDQDYIESYDTGDPASSFSITNNSWVNFTFGSYYERTISPNIWRYNRVPSPMAVFTNGSHGYHFRSYYHGTTSDNGYSWSSSPNGGKYGSAVWYDNWTASKEKEEIYISYWYTYYVFPPFQNDRVAFRRFNITTQTLSSEVWVESSKPDTDMSTHDVTSICKDGNDTLWLVYGGAANQDVEKSTDNGATWAPDGPSLSFLATGDKVQILPIDNDDIMLIVGEATGNNLSYFIRTNSTGTWSTRTNLASNLDQATFSAIHNRSSGDIYLTYMNSTNNPYGVLYFRMYDASAGTWGGAVTIVSETYSYDTAIAVDVGTDDIYVMYSESPTNASNDYYLYSINSTTNGLTWGTSTLENDGAGITQLQVSSNGLGYDNVYAFWWRTSSNTMKGMSITNLTWSIINGNITSNTINITLPSKQYWRTFNATLSDYSVVNFSLLDAANDTVIVSGLTGQNYSLIEIVNRTLKIFCELNGSVNIDSWSISWSGIETSVDAISPYEVTTNPKILNATGPQDLENVTLWYRYSPDNVTWGQEEVLNFAMLTGSTFNDSVVNLNNNKSLNPLKFNTSQTYDSYIFSYTDVSPTRLTVLQDGDYLVCFTLPMLRTDSSTTRRTRLESQIFVNGVQAEVGVTRPSYIRAANGQFESSNHLNVLLYDLSANDYIEIRTQAAGNYFGDSYNVSTDGVFSLYVENITDSQTVFFANATRTTGSTDLNLPADEMKWYEIREDFGYSHDDIINPEDITFDVTGNYLVYVNIPLEGAVIRGNVEGKVLLNGMQVNGGQFKQGYIRNTDGDSNASIHWSGVVQAVVNDILSISVEQSAVAGIITVNGENATLYIQKLPGSNVYFGEATQVGTTSDNWNPIIPEFVLWTTDTIIDTDLYDHTKSQEGIIVNESGDYLLTFNGAFSSAVLRSNNKVTVRVNGVEISGVETKTDYIRQAGQTDASTTLSILLEDLAVGDNITVYVVQEANTGIVNDDTEAILMLWKKPTQILPGCSWHKWVDVSNPTVGYPWNWTFDFPNNTGYYEFYSIGRKTGLDDELPPSVADTRCYFFPMSISKIRILGDTHIRGGYIGGG